MWEFLTSPRAGLKSFTSCLEAAMRLSPTLLSPLLFAAVIAFLFSVAYGQAPLYYSNQNQYFVHAIANVPNSGLTEDWLAKTADPTPIFSAMATFTVRFLNPWFFYVYQGILLGVYAVALCQIFVFVVGVDVAARRWPVFVAALIAVHSALGRWASYQLFGLDYPWYLQAGVAGQYVLGASLQPSVFGVFLIAAVAAFAHGRLFVAAAFVAIGATIHSTYLLPGAMITAGFLASLVSQRLFRDAVKLGLTILLLVAPITIFAAIRFRPTSAETFREALNILVNVRIPHHCRPELWLDPIAILQIVWIAIGIACVRRTKLFAALAVPFSLSVMLTGIQYGVRSDALAALFPWRASAILMPIATAIILSRVVGIARLPLDRRVGVSLAMIVLFVIGGAWIEVSGRGFRSADNETGLYDFVRNDRSPGDVYLLPVRIPNLAAKTRGSLSSDFKPAAEKKTDARLIPIDLQRFRLSAQAPIYVDFKSIPYLDTDLIEWHERLQRAERWTEAIKAGDAATIVPEMRDRGITHVVIPADAKFAAPDTRRIYRDLAYQVFRIQPRPGDEKRILEID